ncbi:hypothetical protein A7982_13425 [Minicystis rosea]|nr:hypothetical protein A7982_13425 [Minicystis rosea]
MLARMRTPLLACFLAGSLLACSPTIDTTPDPPRACLTSFACPDGERCDDGFCVADTACPAAIAPKLIHEQAGIEPAALVVIDGHEYWHGSEVPLEPGQAATESWFVDLATSARSTLAHPPGFGICGGDPLRCTYYVPEGGSPTVLTGLQLAAGAKTWSAAESVTLPAGYDLFAVDQPTAGRWLLWNAAQHVVAAWAPGQGAPEPLLDYGDHTLLGLVEAKGIEKRILRRHNELETATLSSAALEKDASFSPLFSLEGGFKLVMYAVPTGDGRWFVVHDTPGTGAVYRVWRVDADGSTEIGETADSMVALVASNYSSGSPALEDGARGHGALCKADGCRTAEVDFTTANTSPLGSTTVPGASQLLIASTRWLSCDTAEIIAVEQLAEPSPTTKLHRLRVLPNATP